MSCAWKKSRDNLPSPRTLRSSPNPKNGISNTNKSRVRVRIPFKVPPPRSAILAEKDLPWKKPTTASSRILQQASRVDERYIFSGVAQVKGLSNENELPQHECVDQRNPVGHVTDVLLVQNHRFVQKKQPKNRPKIKRNEKKFLELLLGFLL